LRYPASIFYSILLVFISTYSYSQDSSNSSFFFFETDNVYKPLNASVIESRVGVTKNTTDDYLKLDIGTSLDIVGLKDNNSVYSFGVDFFTFSNLRSEPNFKFPVDAIDYLFGINFNYRKPLDKNYTLSARLRISHISSHFEDGHIYTRTDTIFTPVVYSREFINFNAIFDHTISKSLKLRYLIGAEYLFKTIPDDFGAFSGQFGAEVRYSFNNWLTYYLSDEVRLIKANSISNSYNFDNNLETGLRFGFANTRGLNIFFTYYDGQDYKGQYFNRMTNYKAFGFSVDI
jgi:hypothetical protein